MATNATNNLVFTNASMKKTIPYLPEIWRNFDFSGLTDVSEYGPYFPKDRSRASVHADVVPALLMILGMEYIDPNMPTVKRPFAVVHVGADHYFSEACLDDGSQRLTDISFANGLISSSDAIMSGVARRNQGFSQQTYRIAQAEQISNTQAYDFTGFMLCCIAYIWQKAEANEAGFDKLSKAYCETTLNNYLTSQTVENQKAAKNLFVAMSSTIQFGIKEGHIKVSIPANGATAALTQNTLNALTGKVIAGTPVCFSPSTSVGSTSGTMTFGAAKAEFEQIRLENAKTLSAEEMKMIPSFSDDIEVLPEALTIARAYVGTMNSTEPMKNFGWRAGTAYGKSTGTAMIAALLGLPLVRITCFTNMETSDFLSSFVPDTGASGNVPALDFDSISFDPEGAYEMLTGTFVPNVSCNEVFELYKKTLKESGKSSNGFKRVESNYIKGLINGYVVEVQERSRIKNRGVLVGLNEFNRPDAVIPMVDGSYELRHPRALVISTDNSGYESCYDLDPSVIRRDAFIIDSPELTEEQVMSRLKFNTGCKDESLMGRLYDIWVKIGEHCKDNEITDGSVSVMELQNWLMLVMMGGESMLTDYCKCAVISKATSDPDEQAGILAYVETLL